jgi:hypothetical protein
MNQGGYPHETLPPPDARLVDPYRASFEPIPTPIDDRGIVDIEGLIKAVKSTVDTSYEWPLEMLGTHHFLWPGSWYPNIQGVPSGENPAFYRELSIHKGYMPKVFENWLHIVTTPPPVVDKEIMKYRSEAWIVARDLFKEARQTVQAQRLAKRRRQMVASNPGILKPEFNGEDVIGEEIMQETLLEHFVAVEFHKERHAKIPKEFHFVDLEAEPSFIAKQLGKLVLPERRTLVRAVAA